jgi:hypothetical protein
MEQSPSLLYQLIEVRLDGTLADFVTARWPGKSWRKISAEIESVTGIPVSKATLAGWFAGRIEVSATVRPEAAASVTS